MRRRSRASQPSSADNNNNNDVEAQQAAPKQRELPESQEIEKVPSKKRTLVGDDRRLSQVSNVASGDNYADNVVQVVAASRQPDVHQLLVLTPSGRQTDPKQQQPKSSGKQKEPPRQAGVDEYDHVVDNAPPLYDSVSRERSGRRDKSKPARQESVGTNLAPIPAAKQTIYDVDSSDES